MSHRLRTLLRQHVFVRLTLAHLAAILLISAGAFANFRYGVTLGGTDLEKAIAGSASIGADIFNAVGLILVAACFASRRWVQAVAGSVVLALTLAYSFNAGFGFAASTIDQTVAERTQAKNDAAKIVALNATRPSSSVQSEIDGILSDSRAGGCLNLDGPYTRKHCPKYFALKEELGRALEAEKLGREQTNKPSVVVGHADPLAANVVFFLGKLGVSTTEDQIRPWQSLLFVLLVVLGGPVALWMAESRVKPVSTEPEPPAAAKKAPDLPVETQTGPSEGNDPRENAASPRPPKGPSRIQPGKVIRLTPAATQTLNKIIKEGGEIRASSQNAVAKLMDMSRTTLRRAIENLEEAGQIHVDNDNGFRLAVAA